MKIQKIIFRFLLLAVLLYFTINILNLAEVNENLLTWLWVAGGIALANSFTNEILKFFTIRPTFVTIFVATAILTTVSAYLLDLLIPGFDVKGGTFGPIDFELVVINGFVLDPTSAKILLGIIYALFVSIMDMLNTTKKPD